MILDFAYNDADPATDEDNIKINNRNVRNVAKHDIGISLPSGDTNHTIYGGLFRGQG